MALRSLETWASNDSKARVLADLATLTDSSDSVFEVCGGGDGNDCAIR